MFLNDVNSMDRVSCLFFREAAGVRSRSFLIQRQDRIWPVYRPYPAETPTALKQKLVARTIDE